MFDNLDVGKMYERKKFFRLLFDGIGKEEYIRVFQTKPATTENENGYTNITFWDNIDDLNMFVEKKKYNINTYFNLATTDNEGGQENNLKYRYFLAWDFDKKDDKTLTSEEIMFRFKSLKLWYHAIVDSGNGYHVYMMIDKTDNFQKVEDVTRALGLKLKADPNAMLKTQILRIPLTFNIKDGKSKQVNIVYMFENNIKRYSLDKLYDTYCIKQIKNNDKTIQYALNKSNFPPCIVNILNGVEEGSRNFAMRRIISFLKYENYSNSESYNIIKEWNYKNTPPMSDTELNYQFKVIWEKYSYFGCIAKDTGIQSIINKYCDRDNCKSRRKDDMLFIEGETIVMEYNICEKLKRSKKNTFQLKGSHLLIIGVLKSNDNELYSNQLLEKLTYKGQSCMSTKKLGIIVNELAREEYIIIIKGNKRKGERDFYKLNIINNDEIKQFILHYDIVMGVIRRTITEDDFKIFCFMKYRLSKNLNVTQEIIADELNISQPNVSFHINNLIEAKYLDKYINNKFKCIYTNNIYKLYC